MEQTAAFHNSIELTGNELHTADKKACTQEDKILQFFERKAGKDFTPSEVYQQLTINGVLPRSTPVTSIRRAITNLTASGKLIKTGNRRAGTFGTLNFTWTIKGEIVQGELFN